MPSILPILQRRRERRLTQQDLARQRLTGGGVGCGLVFSILLGLGILGLAFGYAWVSAGLPAVEVLPALIEPPNGELLQPTRLYDRSGARVLAVLAPEDAPRRYVPLDPLAAEHLPEHLARVTIALNDPGFESHPGYLLGGLDDPELHPTLAQRLAADLLLWNEPPSLRRALRERILAGQMTARFGRQKVLEWYLNTANYGRYAYGSDSASRLYLGKPASELALAESALLAAVAQSPAINPLDAPQAALQRQAETLDDLAGQGLFSSNEINQARSAAVYFAPAPASLPQAAPAFTALALAQLDRDLNRARVERGGMLIYTSLDYDLYQQSLCAAQTQLERLQGLVSDASPCPAAASLPALPPGPAKTDAAASVVVIDPQNGQILAVVGEIRQGTESALLTGHRPGLLLTPFLYLTGFSRGLSPATLAWDLPRADSGLQNPDGVYHGPVRLRLALANDYLIPASDLLEQMSLPAVLQTMRPFGIEPLESKDLPALLDGNNLVSPLALARAYGVFAAEGLLVDASSRTLLKVETVSGRAVLEWSQPSIAQVTSPQLAYLVTHVLSDDSARWPSLGRPSPLELGFPAAAKLGQTLDGADAWAAGYTNQRVAVVWMNGSPRAAAGLWAAVMKTASRDLPASSWKIPQGVTTLQVCDPSGLLPTEACPNVVSEVFLNGYEPLQADTLYKTYAVNRETGFLATVFTPAGLVEERTYMIVPELARDWAARAGLPNPPSVYDTIQSPPFRADLHIASPAMFASVNGKVQVRGSAAGADFDFYRLQYGQGLNPSQWVLLTESQTPVTDGLLGVWDTNGLTGLYALQLVVIRSGQRVETYTVQVTLGE